MSEHHNSNYSSNHKPKSIDKQSSTERVQSILKNYNTSDENSTRHVEKFMGFYTAK